MMVQVWVEVRVLLAGLGLESLAGLRSGRGIKSKGEEVGGLFTFCVCAFFFFFLFFPLDGKKAWCKYFLPNLLTSART